MIIIIMAQQNRRLWCPQAPYRLPLHRFLIRIWVLLILATSSCQSAAVSSPHAGGGASSSASSASKPTSLRAPRRTGSLSSSGPGVQTRRGQEFQSGARAGSRQSALLASSSSAWVDGCKSALASALSAACVKTLLQPIDAVKTYQQYTYATSGTSVSLVNAIRGISSRPGGWGNFYAGLGVTVLGSMPGVSIYFGVYSYCKRRLLSTELGRQRPMLCVAVSAALGNSVASFSRVPYEVVKQQLQTGAYSSTLEALSTIVRSGPRQALGHIFPKGGIAIQMWRDVPYAVVTLLLYETLQASIRKRYNGSGGTGPMSSRRRKVLDFVVGGAAGGMGSWVTNPQDVIKTRLQTNSDAYGGSVAACAAALWKEGGPSVFLRGSVPRLLHKVPANAFFFLFYEVFRRLFRVSEVAVVAADDARTPSKGKRRA